LSKEEWRGAWAKRLLFGYAAGPKRVYINSVRLRSYLESAAPWAKILLRRFESFLYCRLSASGAWEGKRGLCGFFVARITKIGRLLI
jgi:hypothetical protein